jgi:hypothetical protein
LSAETKRAHLLLSGGPAVIAAVVATVEHFAQEAGLGKPIQRNLMEAAEQVCGDALRRADSPEAALEVSIEEHPDRLEIAIAHPSIDGPAVGLDSFLGIAGVGAAETPGANLLSKVDRVRYDSAGQVSRMILVKYLPGANKTAN